MKNLEQLEKIINEQQVVMPLEFVIRTMKVMELAQEFMDDGEQKELVGNYANTLFHEVSNFVSSEELSEIEENNLLEEL